MPLAGKGMLLTSMNIDVPNEPDFNRWYDREHLEERVAIEGFLEARRYVAHAANPKYLSLYSTATLDVLDSPAYRARLANQTEWSRRSMAHFKDMLRVVARITISNGTGRGAALGLVRLRPTPDNAVAWRDALQERLAPEKHDGIISMHLLESEPELSGATAGYSGGAQRRRARLVRADRRHACRRGLVRDRRALHRPCRLAIPASRVGRLLLPDVGPREERHRAQLSHRTHRNMLHRHILRTAVNAVRA
ncbi:hypothetical protein ACVWZL_005677 [Bradyrhizobium sp. GM2.4]